MYGVLYTLLLYTLSIFWSEISLKKSEDSLEAMVKILPLEIVEVNISCKLKVDSDSIKVNVSINQSEFVPTTMKYIKSSLFDYK